MPPTAASDPAVNDNTVVLEHTINNRVPETLPNLTPQRQHSCANGDDFYVLSGGRRINHTGGRETGTRNITTSAPDHDSNRATSDFSKVAVTECCQFWKPGLETASATGSLPPPRPEFSLAGEPGFKPAPEETLLRRESESANVIINSPGLNRFSRGFKQKRLDNFAGLEKTDKALCQRSSFKHNNTNKNKNGIFPTWTDHDDVITAETTEDFRWLTKSTEDLRWSPKPTEWSNEDFRWTPKTTEWPNEDEDDTYEKLVISRTALPKGSSLFQQVLGEVAPTIRVQCNRRDSPSPAVFVCQRPRSPLNTKKDSSQRKKVTWADQRGFSLKVEFDHKV